MARWGTVAERVEERIQRDARGGCWLWRGGRGGSGYGRFANDEAHRVVYRLLVGPIPEGMHLDHLCRVTMCVNPEHLEPVTPAENARRRALHKTTCPKGHPLDGRKRDKTSTGGECRYCMTCHRAEQAARAERLKENHDG